ncbi:MAG: MMPL family transporter, partial [Deltaproteobacteria bacterium]
MKGIDTAAPGQPAQSGSPTFRRWASLVVRHRLLFLLATLLTTGFFGYAAANKLRIDTSTEAFMASHSAPAKVLEELRDEFGEDSEFQLVVVGDVFTLPYLEQLKALHQELARIDLKLPSLGKREAARALRLAAESNRSGSAAPGQPLDAGWGAEKGGSLLDQITSLINVRRTEWRDDGLAVGGLLDEWPSAEQLPALRERVLHDVTLAGRLVSQAAHHSVIALKTASLSEADSAVVYRQIVEIASRYDRDGFRVLVAGLPALNASMNQAMQDDFGRMFAISLMLMVAILWAIFRHPIGIFGPVLVVIQAALWTLGMMALTDTPMTLVTNIMPAFLICVGIGDSIHVQSAFRDLRAAGHSARSAVVEAIADGGRPIMLTAVTTAVALLGLEIADLDAVKNLGRFAAWGVIAAFVHSMIFLPIALSCHGKGAMGLKPNQGQPDWLDRVLARCHLGSVSRKGRNRILLGAVLVASCALFGVGKLGVHHDPMAWLPDGMPVKTAFQELNDHVGGAANVELLIEAENGASLKDADVLQSLAGLETYIKTYKDPRFPHSVDNITSLLDVVRETNRALHGGDQAFYLVPDDANAVRDILTLFESSGAEELRKFATIDMKKSRMTVRVAWMHASAYAPLTEHIEKGIQQFSGSRLRIVATGTVFNIFSVVRHIIDDLVGSFTASFLMDGIVMTLFLGSLRLGLLALLPNFLPILVMMGLMGALGIGLDGTNL